MIIRPDDPTLTKIERDSLSTWLIEHGPQLIQEQPELHQVAADMTRDLRWNVTVRHLDVFRRQVALAFAACPHPAPQDRLSPFWGLAAVLSLVVWVFLDGHPLDACFVDLSEKVSDR